VVSLAGQPPRPWSPPTRLWNRSSRPGLAMGRSLTVPRLEETEMRSLSLTTDSTSSLYPILEKVGGKYHGGEEKRGRFMSDFTEGRVWSD